MKKFLSAKQVRLTMLVVFAAAICRALLWASPQSKPETAPFSGDMKTVCVGRMLVDLPESAEITIKMANVDGFEVTSQNETPTDFAHWMAEREQKLGLTPNMLGRKNIELSKKVQEAGSSGRTFVHGRYRGYDVKDERRIYYETVTIEGHVNKDGITFSFLSKGDDPGRISVVEALMAQVVNTNGDNLLKVPGFCLDKAIIADPFDSKRHESVTAFASVPDYPDIRLAFWTNTGLHHGPGLIERDATATDALTRVRSHTLRSGARTISRFAGEELGIKTTELNFSTNFSFAWETGGSKNDAFVPRLLLELDTGVNPRSGGKPVQSSLNEEAVIRLWDRISSSVRLWPIRPVEVARNAPLAFPPGIYGEAGERCPQSSWWSCSEPDKVNGTETEVLAPHLVFRMDTGNGDKGSVPSLLSDGAALALWDTVSSSIRLHHAHTPKPPVASTRTTTASAYVSAPRQAAH